MPANPDRIRYAVVVTSHDDESLSVYAVFNDHARAQKFCDKVQRRIERVRDADDQRAEPNVAQVVPVHAPVMRLVREHGWLD